MFASDQGSFATYPMTCNNRMLYNLCRAPVVAFGPFLSGFRDVSWAAARAACEEPESFRKRVNTVFKTL